MQYTKNYDRNGILILDDYWMNQLSSGTKKKKGCNSANCPPLAKSTPYHHKVVKGVSLAKYSEVWP
jgi:hypothetical protein